MELTKFSVLLIISLAIKTTFGSLCNPELCNFECVKDGCAIGNL
jgi:hypothetical protein